MKEKKITITEAGKEIEIEYKMTEVNGKTTFTVKTNDEDTQKRVGNCISFNARIADNIFEKPQKAETEDDIKIQYNIIKAVLKNENSDLLEE